MSGVDGLRSVVTGLIGLAATAEQVLLAETTVTHLPPDSPQQSADGPHHWAAVPVIAHNTCRRRRP